MTNLLTNPKFTSGLDSRGNPIPSLNGWTVDNLATWHVGCKAGVCAAQCDQDEKTTKAGEAYIAGWPLHTDGRLYQDVTLLEPHSQISLSLTEVQHHGDNVAVVTVYGRVDGDWQVIWQRPGFGDDVPANTVDNRTTWYTNVYVTLLEVACTEYRVEFLGRVDSGIPPSNACGWKITNVVLEVS